MARDLNDVNIIGRLVRDPEIRYTASGTPVAKFSIANNMTYVQNNERKDSVNYFDVNVWGNQAVNCEKYLKKGNQVAINGSLRQNRWVDKASGQTRSKIEITANTVQFLTVPTGGGGSGFQAPEYSAPANNNSGKQNAPDEGFIEDPWNEGSSSGMNDPFSDTFNDEDIPF